MRRFHRFLAGIFAVILVVSTCISPILASESQDTIFITSTEEFLEFAKLCTYDGYSKGKEVQLQTDIDLTDTTFEDIPIFLGTFLGGGHTISGFSRDMNKDGQGLFRHIATGATVSDLHLEGDNATSYNTIGGLAAENYGTIQNCTYRGVISGLDAIGGMAAINYGAIDRCTTYGGVYGETNIGGIAGINEGTISNSFNYAQVNTDLIPSDISLVDFTTLDVTNTEETVTNVGGIAGDNQGTIQNTTNCGAVGYPHVGYNVGGIAGNHTGYLDGCTNQATVYGRRDVGGVVGQFQPYLQQSLSNSKLQDLREELDNLSTLSSALADQAKISNSAVSNQVDTLLDAVDDTKAQTESLLNQSQDLLETNVDAINDLSTAISETLDSLEPIADSFDPIADQLSAMADSLEQASDGFKDTFHELEELEDISEDIQGDLEDASNSWDRGTGYLQSAIAELEDTFDLLRSGDLTSLSLTDISTGFTNATAYLSLAVVQISDTADSLKRVVAQMDDITDVLDDANDEVQLAFDHLSDGFSSLGDTVDALNDTADLVDALLEDINSRETFQLTKADDTFDETKDALSNSLDVVGDTMDGLNAVTQDSADDLVDDMRAVSDQFAVISDLIVEILQDATSFDEESILDIEDVSATVQTATMGKVSNATNRGAVEGDINVGGLVGNISFEYDTDFLDRLDAGEDKTQAVLREAIAIVETSTNSGDVVAKKDGAGGLVGYQDYGLIQTSTAASAVESTTGGYVGGIVGQSTAMVRQCFAKTTLSGTQFVGGIAGSGYHIQDCYALTAATASDGALGGIVGQLDSEGTLLNNYFVGETLGGLDGISYDGQAQSLTYEELLDVAGIPDVFRTMTIRFFADEQLFTAQTVQYGDSLTARPEPPQQEGYFLVWEDVDTDCIVSDMRIYGEYLPMLTTIRDENDENLLSTILVDGQFTDQEVLVVTALDSDQVGQFALSVDGAYNTITAIRYLAPDVPVQIQLLQEGKWVNVDVALNGKYLYIPLPDGTTTVEFRAVELILETYHAQIAIGVAILLALAVLTIVLVKWSKRRKQQKELLKLAAASNDKSA